MQQIAIIGSPNVGKSSLFNRLLNERIAITSDIAGTTRDTKANVLELDGHFVQLIDTGGISTEKQLLKQEQNTRELFLKVSQFAMQTALKSDLILFVVSGKLQVDTKEKELFLQISSKHPKVVLVVNKIDNQKQELESWSFLEFGAKETLFVSASHNRGIEELLQTCTRLLHLKDNPSHFLPPKEQSENSLEDFLEQEENKEIDRQINIGIIGRVNVGKSSLLNALLGEERSLVSSVAGTTLDPVDECMQLGDRILNFVDTAGIRRRGQIEGIEKFALDRTRNVLKQTDIALLVLDCSKPFVELDEKIAGLVDEYHLGVIVVFNKWDIAHNSFKAIQQEFLRRFKFLEYAPILTISATTQRHIQKLQNAILEVFENFCRRIPTAKLNETIAFATNKHKIPSDHGKVVKIYYATQYDIKPPQIALIMNRPKSLHFSYKRYLVNTLREHFNFIGTPISIQAKSRQDQ